VPQGLEVRILPSAQVGNVRRLWPSSERFGRVNAERFVLEHEVRTDDLKNEPSRVIGAALEAGDQGIAEGNEELRGFEPRVLLTERLEPLGEAHPLPVKGLPLLHIFLVGQKFAEPELREGVELASDRSQGRLLRAALGRQVVRSLSGHALEPGKGPPMESVRNRDLAEEGADISLEVGEGDHRLTASTSIVLVGTVDESRFRSSTVTGSLRSSSWRKTRKTRARVPRCSPRSAAASSSTGGSESARRHSGSPCGRLCALG